MAQPTGYMTFADLWAAVGLRFFGTTGVTGDNLTLCKSHVNEGYINFLGEYDWSFLKPYSTLSVTAEDMDIALPDDFGGMLGDPTNQSSSAYPILEQKSPDWIRNSFALYDQTGIPVYYAIEPIDFVAATGQQWQILLYPKPSASFTLSFRYRITPDVLATDAHFPLGGAYHSQTILLSACEVAEGVQGDTKGIWSDKYHKALEKSIAEDMKYIHRNVGSLIREPNRGMERIKQVDIVEL